MTGSRLQTLGETRAENAKFTVIKVSSAHPIAPLTQKF
jgi:hypothetical protein